MSKYVIVALCFIAAVAAFPGYGGGSQQYDTSHLSHGSNYDVGHGTHGVNGGQGYEHGNQGQVHSQPQTGHQSQGGYGGGQYGYGNHGQGGGGHGSSGSHGHGH